MEENCIELFTVNNSYGINRLAYEIFSNVLNIENTKPIDSVFALDSKTINELKKLFENETRSVLKKMLSKEYSQAAKQFARNIDVLGQSINMPFSSMIPDILYLDSLYNTFFLNNNSIKISIRPHLSYSEDYLESIVCTNEIRNNTHLNTIENLKKYFETDEFTKNHGYVFPEMDNLIRLRILAIINGSICIGNRFIF